jgi:hypothetical protein
MRFCTSVFGPTVVLAIVFLPHPRVHAQQADPAATIASPVQPIPEAPTPQIELAQAAGPQAPQQTQTQTPAPAQPAQQPQTPAPAPDPSSSSQTISSQSSQQPTAQKSQKELAEEQLKEQETQRVAGIMATFNTTRNPNALPLSPSQKYRLFFKGALDPWAFGLTAFVAGIGQAEDSTPEWGGGMQGYGKRLGAGYADYFMGNFFGNAVLTSLLHEDPRYFQKGSGKPIDRVLWAAASTVWCKRDKGGWGPNYANVGGNLIGAAIGRVYYPAADRTVSSTISDGLTVSAEGILGAEVIEWWPDLVRHYRRKQAEKQARATDAADGQKKDAKPEDQNKN